MKTVLLAISIAMFGVSPAFAVDATSGDKPVGDVDSEKAGATNESAKMGKEEGTHTGTNQGAKPENDTKKVDQPERRNVPSNETTKPAAPE
jgi:hypothetical protein